MDLKDIRLLKILEVIEKNPAPSQRELAKRLNISLGLINAFIRRSAESGYVKISPLSKNRLKYNITSKGTAEKKRLTQAFLSYGYRFFKEAKERIRAHLRGLEKKNVQRVVFFGTGELAEIAYLTLQDTCLEMVAVVDDRRVGESFSDRTVRETGCLHDLVFDRILITGECVGEKLYDNLDKYRIPHSKIVQLF